MFLTHCVTGWTVLTVLGLGLPVWSAVKVTQPYRVETTNGTARIPCLIQPRPAYNHIQPAPKPNPAYPYPDPEEFRVTLLRSLHGTRELCSSVVNLTERRDAAARRDGEVQCSAQVREGAVEVTVSGLTATDTDIYRCKIEVFYPPPYLRLTGNGTLVHVLGSPGCPEQEPERQTQEGDEDEADEATAPLTTPVAVLVVLIIVVLVVIIYFQVVQCERGKAEPVRQVGVRQVPGGAHKVDAVACCYENVA